MNLELYKTSNPKGNTVIAVVYGAAKRLFRIEEEPLSDKEMDEGSNGRIVKKQLRCAVSGCFDKDNICCKECDIKKCRFKCNFIDKEVCEHQFI